jgi:hypothetical protein
VGAFSFSVDVLSFSVDLLSFSEDVLFRGTGWSGMLLWRDSIHL